MPNPGDQHRAIANPFEEPPQRISTYTAQEIATLQSRLEKQLGPEYISSRVGPGGAKVHYLAADKCIQLANQVFGFNGWSSSIQNVQVDFVDEHPTTGKISLGLSVIMRVTLRDGTYHEDIGYGQIENCKSKASAFEKAKKEGTTDGLKRALRSFGNVLGNCIYDKTYLAQVGKVKAAPTSFDPERLYRAPGFIGKKDEPKAPVAQAPVAQAPAVRAPAAPAPVVPNVESAQVLPTLPLNESFGDVDYLGELDEADFAISEDDHPDEVVLPPSNASTASNGMQPPARPMVRSESTGSNYPRQPHTPNHQQPPKPVSNAFNRPQNHNAAPAPRPQPQQFNNQRGPASHNGNNPVAQPQGQGQQAPIQPPVMPPGGAPVGFFSARAVTQIPEDSLAAGQIPAPKAGMAFDPRAESPSIRKTPGIDHTKSKPVARDLKHVPPAITEEKPAAPGPPAGLQGNKVVPRPNQGGPPMARGNVVNPQLDHARRIGAPGQASPLANRNQYRPPTMKRPSGGDGGPLAPGQGRAPLADLSNTDAATNAGGVGGILGPDAKRQRMN